jgi:hypothetical protein
LSLQGSLDAFALSDVLRLLAATGKTGCLSVDGDGGRGNVWINEGALVGAEADRAPATVPFDEVIFELLRFTRGSFSFRTVEMLPEGDQATQGLPEPLDIESTLRRAVQLLEEWRSLEPVVPSLSHRVAMRPQLTGEHVTVDARIWPVVVAVAPGRSVGELAGSLGLGELGVGRLVSHLVELGVVIVEPPQRGVGRTALRRHTTGDLPVATYPPRG